jgi:hypothetical protein
MNVLFDQGTPVPIRPFLTRHAIATVYERRWHQLKNGDLIRMAEQNGFDVLLTTDQNLKYQQNLRARNIAVVVLLSTSWPRIQSRIDAVVSAVDSATVGSYVEVSI